MRPAKARGGIVAKVSRPHMCFLPREEDASTMATDVHKIWEASLGHLQLQMPRPSYETWLKGTFALSLDNQCLTVGVPTAFAAEWLERRMQQLIQRTVSDVATSPLHVRFQVASAEPRSRRGNGTSPATSSAGVLPLPEGTRPPVSKASSSNNSLNPRYTFQNFVIGKSNHLAYAAAAAVAECPGEQYNPLFIYSGVGLGKTHLLHAIASAVAQRNLQPLYVTAEQFTNEFIQAIRERKTMDFRAKYRTPEVLLLDDIQFLSGKEQTQEGLFHTFNDLHNGNRQIVIASDRPPRAVSLIEERLRSRFQWGLITDIQPPDLETRLAILYNKAHALGADLTEDVAQIMAKQAYHSVRELEGCLTRLHALGQFTGAEISASLVPSALADLALPPATVDLAPDEAIIHIADYYRISPQALCTRTHDRKTTHPQRVAMFILTKSLRQPIKEIANLLGHWNKKTITNGRSQVAHQMDNDAAIHREVTDILQRLGLPQD